MKFGTYLLKNSIINEIQLKAALKAQNFISKKVGRVLLELEYISKEELNLWLNKFIREKQINLTKECILTSFDNLNYKSDLYSTVTDYDFLPLKLDLNGLSLVTYKIDDREIEKLEERVESDLEIKIISKELYEWAETVLKSKKCLKDNLNNKEQLKKKYNESEINPYNKLYTELIEKAKLEKVSDIHITPHKRGIDIKLRKFGKLSLWKSLSIEHRDSFIAHCKHLLNLNVAIIGLPQDARTSIDYLKLDLRINSTPMIYGNKIVIRLLDREKEFNIDKLGISNNIVNELKQACQKKAGLILISGQTGSGKTSTLYSLLSHLNTGYLNISTIEDPVEYTLEGLDQIDITSKKDLTFSNSLRALLRQDPDVILVGEVRDEETANLCLKAASSGHLVFTTIHAENPETAVKKLVDFGCDINLIKESLLISMNQCLVPIVCQNCSTTSDTNNENDKELYDLGIKDVRNKNVRGCNHCFEGNTSMQPINELLGMKEARSILAGEKVRYISKKDKAFLLLKDGLITPSTYNQF